MAFASVSNRAIGARACIEPPQDNRVADPPWQQRPFNLIHHAFLARQQCRDLATSAVFGVSRHHKHVVSFVVRQISPDHWIERRPPQSGSWWPAWVDWLKQHSSARAARPPMDAAERGYSVLDNAPGTYVSIVDCLAWQLP